MEPVKNRPWTSTPRPALTSVMAAWKLESVELQPVWKPARDVDTMTRSGQASWWPGSLESGKVSIQQQEEAEPPCKCLGGQRSQTPTPAGPQQTIALQTSAQNASSADVSTAYAGAYCTGTTDTGEQTTSVLAGDDGSSDYSYAYVSLDHRARPRDAVK
ncbi:hypothetical protein MRX96_037400 [Rhipicephalus microplus]